MKKINKIYGIKNKENEYVYIGKTNQTLEKRFIQHKSDDKHPDKANYFKNPLNECVIEELYSSEFSYDINDWEQHFLDMYSSDRENFFNKIRAKKMSNIDKQMTAKIMLREDHTNKGEFETDDNFDDFLDGC